MDSVVKNFITMKIASQHKLVIPVLNKLTHRIEKYIILYNLVYETS